MVRPRKFVPAAASPLTRALSRQGRGGRICGSGVDAADALVYFQYDLDTTGEMQDVLERALKLVRGGRHIEFGYAMAQGKPLFIVGRPENVFHKLSYVDVVDDIVELIEHLC